LGGDSEAVRPLKHRRDSKRYFLAKSVEDFNSLHAQREACEAFIASQQGEGWKLIKAAYDDGGISGGTMEPPALQRLLDDIGHELIGAWSSTRSTG
jgi:DNA invertase Pin-like site-specific DNA recombinase